MAKVRIVKVTRILTYEGTEEDIAKILTAVTAAVPAIGSKVFGEVRITSGTVGIPAYVRDEERKGKGNE